MTVEDKIKDLWWWYKFKFKNDPFSRALRKWYLDMGDVTLRYDYPNLGEKSIVLDIGGHIGSWSHKIVSMYDPYVFILEPVRKHHEIMKRQFKSNPKIKILNFALSDSNKSAKISLFGVRSSIYKDVGPRSENVTCIDVYEFFTKFKLKKVDLMKLNVEGGEYKILNRMIEKDLIRRCDNIQIQFHNIDKNSKKERLKIRNELSKTHKLTYDYYFMWENWQKK